MKIFFTRHKKLFLATASILFWLVVWEIAARIISQQLFLASPIQVLKTLYGLLGTPEFYSAVSFSFLRIGAGFFSAVLIGSLLAIFAHKLPFLETLLRPLMGVAKSAPVASFVVLALLLFGSENLSVLISFLMVLPVFYTNMLTASKSVELERLEAADVFGMIRSDRFRFIYLPYVAPLACSSCEIGIGIAWKAGVSAEVIGIAAGSIGEKIYESKLYLNTAELFAYTLVVIVFSLLLEQLMCFFVRYLEKKLTD